MKLPKAFTDNPTDPIGAAVGSLITILAILHIPEKMGMSADEVAALGGALIMFAASIRTIAKRRHANK